GPGVHCRARCLSRAAAAAFAETTWWTGRAVPHRCVDGPRRRGDAGDRSTAWHRTSQRRRRRLGRPGGGASSGRRPNPSRRRGWHCPGGNGGMTIYVFAILLLFVLITVMKAIKIVPQKQVKIIERLGKFHRTAEAGLNTVLPFLDSVRE